MQEKNGTENFYVRKAEKAVSVKLIFSKISNYSGFSSVLWVKRAEIPEKQNEYLKRKRRNQNEKTALVATAVIMVIATTVTAFALTSRTKIETNVTAEAVSGSEVERTEITLTSISYKEETEVMFS